MQWTWIKRKVGIDIHDGPTLTGEWLVEREEKADLAKDYMESCSFLLHSAEEFN